MHSRQKLWKAYNLAKDCFCRPSDLYGIENSYVAYCFDEAVITFGNALRNELDKASDKAKDSAEAERKQKMVLSHWLDDPKEESTPSEKRFATPVATKKKAR